MKRRDYRRVTQKQLRLQSNRCVYCGNVFGDFAAKTILRPTLEHFIPYSSGQKSIVFAVCQICNSLKSNKLFTTIKEARVYLRTRWKKKKLIGFRNVSVPSVASKAVEIPQAPRVEIPNRPRYMWFCSKENRWVHSHWKPRLS